MRKPSLTDALATKAPTPAPAPPATEAPGKAADAKVATTLRILPSDLESLKIMAARRRVKVNDLILDGVRHVLALHAPKS
jgi:hypothetical protein